MAILTIDVGQKYIRYGFFSKDGVLTEKGQYLISRDSSKHFYQSVADLITNHNGKTDAVSLSFPGFINGKKGVAIRAGSLKFLDGHNIKDDLHQYIDKNIEIFVENNTNCAAIAEKLNGNAQDVHDFVVMTLGNGIGGGIFINNQLLRGSRFTAGEFGMMITDYTGHNYETEHELGSAAALISDYSEMRGIPDGMAEDYQIMSELDDPKVKETVDKWANYVAILIFNLACTINPQRILIGGKISQNNELIPIIENQLNKIPNWHDFEVEVKPCHFFNDASLYGAYWAYIGSKENVLSKIR